MMRTKRARVPEGGAIEDGAGRSAEEYGREMLRRLEGEYRRFAAEVVARGLPPRREDAVLRVLEIGPGPGWVSVFVGGLRPDVEITALDASADMVRACSANFAAAGLSGRARVLAGEAERLTESVGGGFDLVFSRDSLHHWTDPAAVFSQARSALKAGGRLVIADERRDLGVFGRCLVAALSRAMGPMGAFWRSSIAAAYTPDELAAFLSGAGFSGVRVDGGLIDLRAEATK